MPAYLAILRDTRLPLQRPQSLRALPCPSFASGRGRTTAIADDAFGH